MTPEEILHEIVKSDRDARERYDQVIRMQQGFDSFVEETGAKLRDESYKKANEEIAEFEAKEVAKADAEIDALCAKSESDIEKSRERFQSNRAALIDNVFATVVGKNA